MGEHSSSFPEPRAGIGNVAFETRERINRENLQ